MILKHIHQYINKNNLAVCQFNYQFVGVYFTRNIAQCSIFLGNWDLINEKKIIASKIYYIAGLTKCSDKEFNKTSPTIKFHIDLGDNMKVRYYNFQGAVSYKNRNLIHCQTTDILNPPKHGDIV